ncbi:MAG: hypothetical protein GSR78_02410 [Desulfurococcales archaeon]|nr:hypothetical protein [Desulfurococcales archaeon]
MKTGIKEPGVCPECMAPVEYEYTFELGDDSSVAVRINVECPVCGYRDTKKIVFPLRALSAFKYLLKPEARLIVEGFEEAAQSR